MRAPEKRRQAIAFLISSYELQKREGRKIGMILFHLYVLIPLPTDGVITTKRRSDATHDFIIYVGLSGQVNKTRLLGRRESRNSTANTTLLHGDSENMNIGNLKSHCIHHSLQNMIDNTMIRVKQQS